MHSDGALVSASDADDAGWLERTLARADSARQKAAEKGDSPLIPPSEITAKADVSSLPSLPSWGEEVRAVPNALLRCALFGIIPYKKDARLKMAASLDAVDGLDVLYEGDRLDQQDLTTWMGIVQAVRFQKLGTVCYLRPYSLLKLIGQTDTGKNRAALRERIKRLVKGDLEVYQARKNKAHKTFVGHLISDATLEQGQEWKITLSEGLIELFGFDQFSYIDWAIRRSLAGHQMAQWLHGFYSSHARPVPYKPATLLRLCGSQDKSLSSGTQNLLAAMDAVVAASKEHGATFDYELENGLLHVSKLGTAAQQRHLAKKYAGQLEIKRLRQEKEKYY